MLALILLAVMSLSGMGLLTLLFLKLNQSQMTLIQNLSTTNQSLLNQVRSKDISTLAGLESVMKPVENDEYTSTDLREMQAYYAGLQANSTSFGIGESLSDEDLENFKGVL